MKRRLLVGALTLGTAALVLAGSTALAKNRDDDTFRAQLNGFNEVVGGPGPDSTGSVSSRAHGTFEATLRDHDTKLDFTLTYSGIEGGTVTQSHPHFAQRHVGGGVFGFFCGGSKHACPTPSGTVKGTWTAADVIGPGPQGVQAGEFAEFVRALRAGAVYVNVHSTNFPEGEIRGQVGGKDKDDDD
jgi:hypothetical protein